MIRLICASTVVWLAGVVLTGWALAAPAAPGAERRWDFQGDAVGSSPAGFSFDRTGEGRAGKWAIEVDPTAPSGDHVLAQLDRDVTDHRFPVAVADAPELRDVRAEVRCKPVSGEVDRACGLVVRYRDARNYYVARANALEGNVNLYRVVDGRRQQIKGGARRVVVGDLARPRPRGTRGSAAGLLGREADHRRDRRYVQRGREGRRLDQGRLRHPVRRALREPAPVTGAASRQDSNPAGQLRSSIMKTSLVALAALVLGAPARAQAPAPSGAAASGPAAAAPTTTTPAAPAITPSRDFPQGTATPSADCGACHQAIHREYAEGFGSDMKYPGVKLRAKVDKVLELPAGTSVAASAHAVSGTDPWPIHAREAEEEGKKCNVCHFPQPFAIPERSALEVSKPLPRQEAQGEGITCAACHLTPEGKIRGPHEVDAPHATVADARMSSSEMCAYCHAMGKRIPGKQTQTYLEWRDDFAAAGLGRQQCQDCHMPRTQRKTAEDFDVPVRAVARHLWTGGHSGQRLGSALSLVMLQPEKERANVELHVVNVGAGHSVPTGSNRRAIYLQTRVVDRTGKVLATRGWMFAPWYGPRPDDRAFLKEDEKRPDRIAATQADEQGPHEAPLRAGEERVLTWQPELRDGSYTVEATLVYDLNRYNERSFRGDQRELSRFTLPLAVKAGR